MFPTIAHLGPFEIRTYGALLAISFILGIALSARRAEKSGLDPEVLLGMAWIIVVTGVVGARVLYVLQHLDSFAGDPLEAIKVWHGGLTLYGGLILATVSTIGYLKWKTDRAWAFTDVLAPFVALGEGITRIGCFLNGCCFGKSCNLPWAVTYPEDSVASYHLGYPHRVHPSQLYQAAFGLAAFVFLTWLWRRRKFDGQVFWIFVILEGIGRFATDFARYYEPSQRLDVGGLTLSESQIMAVAFVVIGLVGYGIRRRRETEPTP